MEIAALFGWIGSIAYSVCALPQALFVMRRGTTKGFQTPYIFLALFGSIFSTFYAVHENSWILMLNFGVNIGFWSVILKYKFWPRIDG